MKKIFVSVSIIASLLASVGIASAQVVNNENITAPAQCNVPPDNGIYDNDQLVGCIKAATYAAAIAAQTAEYQQNLPLVKPGDSVTDAFGVSDLCPKFYNVDCVDITGTAQYAASMQSLARQLVAEQVTGEFPRFSGWVLSVQDQNN